MQSGDREPLEGIAEEPTTEESTANRNTADFAQELLDFSQELDELYSASESPAETADMGAAEVTAVSQEDVAENVDVAAAENTAVSQEDVEDMCDKGRPILIQLVKAALDAGHVQPGLGKLGIAIAGHLGNNIDLGTLIGIGIAGVECGHELHGVQERIAVLNQQQDKLKLERDALVERVAEAELLAGGAESQLSLVQKTLADERAEHASVMARHAARIRELEGATAKLEAQAREARRSTVFERPVDAGTSEPVVGTGPVFVSDGVDKKPLRRRRTTLLEEEDGTMRPMSNLDLTASFLDGAAKSMPGNKAVDVERLKERGNLIAKGQKLFEDLALEAGVSLGTRACLDPVLSVADMSEAVGKLLAAIKAEKYRDRSAWKDMRDVNRKLSKIFGSPELNRGILSECLRVEEVSSVIEKWDARYAEEIRILPSDNKRIERVRVVAQVRLQDQELLSMALEALLAEHSAPLKEQITAKNASSVTVSDLAGKGFAIMILAETCLDVDHVDNHVQSLFALMDFPNSFELRFHGNLGTYEEELCDSLERFEEVTGRIDKHLLRKLLLMHVMLTSTSLPVTKWREHLQKAEKFQDEMRSMPLMSKKVEEIFQDACHYQRRNFTESFHKAPLPLLEYEQNKAFAARVQGGPSTDSAGTVDQAVAARVSQHLDSVQQATDKMQQAATQIALSFQGARLPANTCWHWAKRGECNRPAGECKFEHMEATKGIQMLSVKGAKSMGGAAPTAVADIVQAALVDGTKGIPNGPVSGTTCIQCGKAPKYCEDGKVHDYCGKACATAAGKYVGKQSTNLGLGSSGVEDDDLEDPSTQLMLAAGFLIPSGMSEDNMCFMVRAGPSLEAQELERMVVDQGGMSFESFEGQLAATAQAIVSGGKSAPANGDAHADLLRRMEEDYGIVFPRSYDDGLELGGANAPQTALAQTQAPQIALGANDAVYFEVERDLEIIAPCKLLTVEEIGARVLMDMEMVLENPRRQLWSEQQFWAQQSRKRVFEVGKTEGRHARALVDANYEQLRMLKWRRRKKRKPGTTALEDLEPEFCQMKYLRALMRALGHKQQDSTLIWEDNKAAILIAENDCSSAGRSKHIDVRFKFVAQAVVEGAVRVRYTPTDLNLADLLTKALPADTFERLRRLCVENKRGDYFDKESDETVLHVQDEKSWMVTTLW